MELKSELRRALTQIPDVLIDPDDSAIRDDALHALDVMVRLENIQNVIAFVGPSGAGRSWLFNAFVGSALSSEGVLRPTTRTLIAATSTGSPIDGFDGVVYKAREMPESLIVVDTPSWEHDSSTVSAFLRRVDIVVVVVSPTRYADASVSVLWNDVKNASILVLNRVDGDENEAEQLARSVAAMFDREPIIVRSGDSNVSALSRAIDEAASHKTYTSERVIVRSILRSSARHLARATAAAAPEIAAVKQAIEAETTFDVSAALFNVADSWLATKQSMVEEVARKIADSDDRIVRVASGPLAERLRTDLGRWTEDVLDGDLEVWRERCRNVFLEQASIRWRRGPAELLIDHYSWKMAINANVVAPARLRRIMGKQLGSVTSSAHDELLAILLESVEGWRGRWAEALAVLGSYQPGRLLTLSNDPALELRHG